MNVSKTNGVKLLAVVAVLAMMFAGVAVMSDSETDAASTIPTEIGGGLTPEAGKYVSQTYTTGEVIVVSDFIIPNNTVLIVDGAKFTVNEGVTITVQAGGQLVFLSGEIIINGDIVATGTNPENDTLGDKSNTPDEDYVAAVINNVEINTTAGSEQKAITLNGNITLERGAKMTATLTGTNKVCGESITNATEAGAISLADGASINVTKRSSGISAIENQNILLNQGATFSTNGHINNVTVAATANTTYYTAGAVSINTDTVNPNYYKVTDKDNKTTDVKETSNLTFTVTSESTPALIQATAGTVTYQQITLRQYILNVDGTVDAGDELAFEKGGSFYTGTTYASVWQAGTKVYYVDNEDHTVATGDENKVILPMTSVTGNLVVTDYKEDYVSTDLSKTYNYNSAVAINGYVSVPGTITVQYDSTKKVSGLVTIDETADDYSTRGGVIYVTGTVTMNAAAFGTESGEDSAIYRGSIIVDGGSIAIAGADVDTLAAMLPYVSASMFTIEPVTEGVETTYLYDFDVAIAKAAEAKVTEVFVFASGYYALGYTCYQLNNAEEAIENGAAVIDADITVPAEMEITIAHGFVVAEGATLTLSEGVLVNLGYGGQDNYAKVFVAGKIVDNDETMAGFDDDTRFIYEVKKTAETETSIIATYTTLAIALSEANPGETIELNNATNPVMINDDVTIPADVTVVSADVTDKTVVMKIDEGAVLTIDGTLVLGNGTIAIMKDAENNGVANGSIVNNNMIVASAESAGVIDTEKEDDRAAYVLNGAVFTGAIGEDYTNNKFFTSVAVAAENSANMEDAAAITINGKNSIGDVTFTKGENADSLTVTFSAGSVTTAGTVTAVGAKIVIADYTADSNETEFTGTVLSQVTAGTSAIALDKAAGVTFQVNSSDDGQTITTTAEIIGTTASGANGKVTVSQGTVAIKDDDTCFKNLIVANGATLDVAKGAKVTTADDSKVTPSTTCPKDYVGFIADKSGLTVDGTMNVAGEAVFTYATVNGTVNVAETGIFGAKIVDDASNVVAINGTLAVAEKGAVGVKEMFIAGTVSGDVNVDSFAIAYPGSIIADAGINMDAAGEETTADVTNFYVNGNAVATLYAESAFTITDILSYIDVSGVNYTAGVEYYSDEAMRTPINIQTTTSTANLENIYISMDASTVTGKISSVQGMTIYIDGLALSNFKVDENYVLTVGDHYVTVQVTPGYSATPVITFNGQTVTDGKITITGEMKEFTLLASGDVSVDTGATGGDGMGLTEILLIILVVLIVVMAIMVALRLMRS